MGVIMLPTKKVTHLFREYRKETLRYTPNMYPENRGQHLYIVSNYDIKEGDCHYDSSDNSVKQWRGNLHSNRLTSKKIEAATDESLTNGNVNENDDRDESGLLKLQSIPQIHQSFIEAYVKAQGKITEVNVEMEESKEVDKLVNEDTEYGPDVIWKRKVKTREDNTIIIHESRKYSRAEVITFISKANNHWIDKKYPVTLPQIEKWIE